MANSGNDSSSAPTEAAKVLLGSTALLTALLTAFGATSDRIPHLLDDATNARILLVIAGILVALTLASGIYAMIKTPFATIVLVAGSILLVGGLTLAIVAAGIGFRGNGRPTITSIKIGGTRPQLDVSFTIRADGVDRDEHIQVVAGMQTLDMDGNQAGGTPPANFTSILRPDDKGVIQQVVEFQLTLTPSANNFAIRAYRAKDRQQVEKGKAKVPVDAIDTDCASKNWTTAPGCIDISLPTKTATASPKPKH